MPGGLAIVLSGGGAKGAFQVGVLDELIVRRGVKVDVFAGVSTGAIQALGGVQNDVPELLAAWLALRGNRDVYRDRSGIIGGLLSNDSLYDAVRLPPTWPVSAAGRRNKTGVKADNLRDFARPKRLLTRAANSRALALTAPAEPFGSPPIDQGRFRHRCSPHS